MRGDRSLIATIFHSREDASGARGPGARLCRRLLGLPGRGAELLVAKQRTSLASSHNVDLKTVLMAHEWGSRGRHRANGVLGRHHAVLSCPRCLLLSTYGVPWAKGTTYGLVTRSSIGRPRLVTCRAHVANLPTR